MSQISRYPNLNQAIESLIGNDGIIVPPFYDGTRWDVFVLGAGHINTTGNLALSTLTINLDGGIADTYPTDAGVANPINYILEVFGGSNINTAAPLVPGNRIVINLNDNVHITGTFIADGDITSTAGNISATAGDVSAGGNVTAAVNVTATTGNLVATVGNLSLANTTNPVGGQITFGGNRFVSNFGTDNTFVGQLSGNTTLTGIENSGFGSLSLASLTTGSDNCLFGFASGDLITSGANNTGMGVGSLGQLTTGSDCIALGVAAGGVYTTESSNICIGNTGTIGDANIIRLGTDGNAAGEQTDCYIAGNTHVTRNLKLPTTTALVGQVQIGGNPVLHSYNSSTNIFVGYPSGNFTMTGINNSGIGAFTLNALTTGSSNSAFGIAALRFMRTGNFNVCFGEAAMSSGLSGDGNCIFGFQCAGNINGGNYNVDMGFQSLQNLSTGSYNIVYGYQAGNSYNGAESSNILFSNSGVTGESNTIRLGTQGVGPGQQDTTFIAGIRGVSPAITDSGIVMIASDHQLGSTGSMTNGEIVIGSTGANPVLGNITSTYLDVINGAGTIDIETLPVLQTDTGFATWGGVGNYFDDTTLGSFTVLRPGTGYINGLPVAWAAPQTVVGMVAGENYYIYIDNTGTLQKTNVRSDALFQNNVVLFECLRDSTLPTNNQITVKENHPFTMPVETSNYLHDVVNTVIENNRGGANITINGTQGIQINGDDFLNDHGLETAIPDSGGVAVVWNKYYTNAGGEWALQNSTNTFTGFYNNAGTPTALSANRFAVYRLYASKDNLNSTDPVYFAILHTAQFNSLVAANTAISNGTIVGVSSELAMLELAQLGYIVYSEASASIVNVVIQKATLRQTISTTGTSTASLVTTDITNFNNILSAADTNVQSALNTIDNLQVARWSVEVADLTAVVNHGYFTQKPGRLDIALPAVSAIGDVIRVANISGFAVGWRITQGAGQQIYIGNTFSTLGAGGYIESTADGDAIELVCYQANNLWLAANAPQGNITVV